MTRSRLLILLAAFILLVPFASRKPDAIQHLLGQPGGAGTIAKAVAGILVTVAVVLLIGWGLRVVRRKGPS